MSYEKINPIQQFNFQINRVLTYGDAACDCQLIRSKTAAIQTFDTVLHLNYQRHEIPFGGKFLNCIKIPAAHSKGTVLVCGGYDSFIEEFVLQVRDLALKNYDVILFEGPGQGRCLSQNMYFRFDFEKPTTAVLDYFKIKQCAMVGISWGGYFALRSAAFEKRIKSVGFLRRLKAAGSIVKLETIY